MSWIDITSLALILVSVSVIVKNLVGSADTIRSWFKKDD